MAELICIDSAGEEVANLVTYILPRESMQSNRRGRSVSVLVATKL